MGAALKKLLAHWDGHPSAEAFHPADISFLSRTGLINRFDHQLAPYPFVGDLETAKVWILMRNPSIGAADHVEETQPPLGELISDNLARRFGRYPFIHLDPVLDPSDAYNWWNHKRGFARLAAQIAERLRTTPQEARKLLAQRVAVLELCPYRSLGFLHAVLPSESSRLARAAALEAIDEAEQSGSRGFLIPWDAAPWGLPQAAFGSSVRNHSPQGFTFRMGSLTGFGEHIWKFAFANS